LVNFTVNYKYVWCNNRFSRFKFFYSNLSEIDFYWHDFLYFNEFNLNNLISYDKLEDRINFLVDFKLTSGFFKKDFNLSSVLIEKLGKTKFNDSLFYSEDWSFNFNNKYFNLDNNVNELENYNFYFNDYKLGNTNDNNYKDFMFSDFTKQTLLNFFNRDFLLHNHSIDDLNLFYDYKNVFFNKFKFINNNYYKDTILNKKYDFEDISELKQFDFKLAKWSFFKSNRFILSFFLNKKIKNKKVFNKFIKNLIKKPMYDFILYFEFFLTNICLRSQFFFNENDVRFFIKNKYILVNNSFISNNIISLKINDVVNLVFDKYYFFYYRNVINDINLTLIKLSNYNYLTDQKRRDFNKQPKKHSPKWVSNLIYFREDIPNYLEVDFLSMSLIILYKPLFYELDFSKVKFLSYFQRHLYNWKFII